ncbi:MAG TPA: F0F1 ATP synthase subunit epsilon [Syntrophorhabdaceae bacterium]|nr:F0F1 ATP synthase subunit epsilon [Syntrophorhabdaceae bacterium]
MNLRILLPDHVFLEERVRKVIAEALNGHFCLLPRHVDLVTALVPGLFSYESEDGRERFLAVGEGVLVKSGREVIVSVRNAMRGPDLGQLRRIVEEEFKILDEHERAARSAVSRIEVNFIRRFLEIREHGD